MAHMTEAGQSAVSGKPATSSSPSQGIVASDAKLGAEVPTGEG